MPSSRAACPAALLISPPAPRRAFAPRHPIVCTTEQYIQDEVSGISERRRGIAAAIIVFAVLTLIPMAPDLADVASMGVPSDFI